MSSIDNVGAYQEMCARLRDFVIDPQLAQIVGYVPELRYADVRYAAMPAADKLWLKFTMVGAREERRTLGTPSRITYSGIAGLQLFVPITDREAAERIRRVSDHMLLAFNTNTSSVNFYNAAIKDQPSDAQWFYKRIDAKYQYVQFK